MRTYRRDEALLAHESYSVAVNSIVLRSAVYTVHATSKRSAGRSLPAAEARNSLQSFATSAGCDPKRDICPSVPQKALLILNADFAVPNGTAAGRSFAPRRPALRVRICVRLCVSFASSGPNLHIYPMPQASLKF